MRIRRLLFAAFGLSLACMMGGCADQSSDARVAVETAAYDFRTPVHEDGSGKFYMGREIARITGHLDAERMDRPSREVLELPSRVIKGMELSPADVVADIGAGTGYFTLRLAKA